MPAVPCHHQWGPVSRNDYFQPTWSPDLARSQVSRQTPFVYQPVVNALFLPPLTQILSEYSAGNCYFASRWKDLAIMYGARYLKQAATAVIFTAPLSSRVGMKMWPANILRGAMELAERHRCSLQARESEWCADVIKRVFTSVAHCRRVRWGVWQANRSDKIMISCS